MDIGLIIRLMPAIIALMGDPNIKALLAQLGQINFPGVSPDKAPAAAISFFDTNTTKWVQTALNLLGNTLTVDGILDEKTKATVRAFQTKHGLLADGWAGDITQTKLRDVLKERK